MHIFLTEKSWKLFSDNGASIKKQQKYILNCNGVPSHPPAQTPVTTVIGLSYYSELVLPTF